MEINLKITDESLEQRLLDLRQSGLNITDYLNTILKEVIK